MNAIQSRLLELVKEIDAVCVRHSIPYYLSGGSVIGALRHKGFIPWDDDIDILIDSSWWKVLYPYLLEEMPAHRALGCLENDNCDSKNPVYRYCDTQSANIHKNELAGGDVAGIDIDIILLDSVPSDRPSIDEHLVTLCLFSDVINPYYSYSHRFDLDIPYARYKEQVSRRGRKEVLFDLEQDLMKYGNKAADCYMVRWAAGPNVFPKEMFGTPKRVQFEDQLLPVPEKAADFLCEVYGNEWFMVPEPDDQNAHETIFDLFRSFSEYYALYLPRIDKAAIDAEYEQAKDSRIATADIQRQDDKTLALMKCCREKYLLDRRVSERGFDVFQLLESRDAETLHSLYDDYMAQQSSFENVGGEMWDGLLRKHDPAYFDIDDDELALMAWLWLNVDQSAKARRVIRARERALSRLFSEALREVHAFIDDMSHASELYYEGDNSSALAIVDRLIVSSKLDVPRLWKMKLAFSVGLASEEQTGLAELLDRVLSLYPEDGEFLKYEVDVMAVNGWSLDCLQGYLHACSNTRNGLIWLSVRQILEQHLEESICMLSALLASGEVECAANCIEIWAGIGCDSVEFQALRCRSLLEFACFIEGGGGSKREHEAIEAKSVRQKAEGIAKQGISGSAAGRFIAILREDRERRGMNARYLELELESSGNMDPLVLSDVKRRLLAIDPQDNSIEKLELLARIERKLGNPAKAICLCREILSRGENEYATAYVQSDLRKMITKMERAVTREYRDALIREWGEKYPSVGEAVDHLVSFGIIEASSRDAAIAYLSRLLSNSIGKVKYSPIYHEMARPMSEGGADE